MTAGSRPPAPRRTRNARPSWPSATRVLTAALAAITADQRVAIVLFDVQGYDYAEIAEMTAFRWAR